MNLPGGFTAVPTKKFYRLLALVGVALADPDWEVPDGLYDAMIDLEPEFVPPNWPDHEPHVLYEEWKALVNEHGAHL